MGKRNAYRRLWYAERRNSGRIHVLLRLLVALLILASLFLSFSRLLLPWLRQAVELDIRNAYIDALKVAAGKVFSQGAGYKEMLVFESAADGSISAITLDRARLDELTDELLHLTDASMGLPGAGKIRVSPFDTENSVLGGNSFLDFDVSVRQDGEPSIDYVTDYAPINNGQTRLNVSLVADVSLSYSGSFLEGKTKVSVVLPATEYLLLGKIPGNSGLYH